MPPTPVDKRIDRLQATLLTTGLQIRDNPTFQVLTQLIGIAKDIQNEFDSIIIPTPSPSGGGSSIVNNFAASLIGLENNLGDDNSSVSVLAGNNSSSSSAPGGLIGYVQFNGGGYFAGDSNLFWDNTNKRLGIGTSSPQRTLQIQADSAVALTVIALYNADTTGGSGSVISYRGVSTGTGANTFFEYASISGAFTTHNNSTAQSTLSLFTRNAGTQVENLRATGNGITLPSGDLSSTVGHIYLSSQGPNTSFWIYVDQTINTDIRSLGYFSQIRADTTTVSITNDLEGIHGKVFFSAGSNNITSVWGAYGEVQRAGTASGTISVAKGVQAYIHNEVAGVISTAYGFYGLVTTSTGTITNGYTIYLESGGGNRPTNSWGLYQVDTVSLNYFGGKLGLGQTTPTARLHISAGTATANTAPLKFTSGTNLTTAEAGSMEYNGTNLFFSPSTTRMTVWVGNDGAVAPATNLIGVIVDYYGSSATRVLTTPNSWGQVVIAGTTYKIPLYT